jgi:hypothetical protein
MLDATTVEVLTGAPSEAAPRITDRRGALRRDAVEQTAAVEARGHGAHDPPPAGSGARREHEATSAVTQNGTAKRRMLPRREAARSPAPSPSGRRWSRPRARRAPAVSQIAPSATARRRVRLDAAPRPSARRRPAARSLRAPARGRSRAGADHPVRMHAVKPPQPTARQPPRRRGAGQPADQRDARADGDAPPGQQQRERQAGNAARQVGAGELGRARVRARGWSSSAPPPRRRAGRRPRARRTRTPSRDDRTHAREAIRHSARVRGVGHTEHEKRRERHHHDKSAATPSSEMQSTRACSRRVADRRLPNRGQRMVSA